MEKDNQLKTVKNILEKYNEKITDDLLSSAQIHLSLGDMVHLYSILIFNDRIVDKTLSMMLERYSKDKDAYKAIEALLEEQKERIENFFTKILDDTIGEL